MPEMIHCAKCGDLTEGSGVTLVTVEQPLGGEVCPKCAREIAETTTPGRRFQISTPQAEV